MKLPNFDEFAPFVAVHKQMDARPTATLSLVAIERLRSVAVETQSSDWQLPVVEKREIVKEVTQSIIVESAIEEIAVQETFFASPIEVSEILVETALEEPILSQVEREEVRVEEAPLLPPKELEPVLKRSIPIVKKMPAKLHKLKHRPSFILKPRVKLAAKPKSKRAIVRNTQHAAGSFAFTPRLFVAGALLLLVSGGLLFGFFYLTDYTKPDGKHASPMIAAPASVINKEDQPAPQPSNQPPASVAQSVIANPAPISLPLPAQPTVQPSLPPSPAVAIVPVAPPSEMSASNPPPVTSPLDSPSSVIIPDAPSTPSDAAYIPTNELPPSVSEEGSATQAAEDSSVDTGLGGMSGEQVPEPEKPPQEILDELMIEKPFDDIRRKAGQEILPEEMLLLPPRY